MESPESFRSRFGRTRILWQTRLGGYCLGLDEFIPMALVPVLDDGEDFDEIERATGIRFFSLERSIRRRDVIDDMGIDRLVPLVAHELATEVAGSPVERWVAMSPYACETLPKFAASMGMACRAIAWDLFFRLSQKHYLLDGLAELGLPRLPGRWTSLRHARYAELASEMGSRFVAQLDIGAAGSGTAFAGSQDDLAQAGAKLGDAEVWVAPYVGPLSLNVNGIATEAGIAVGYPSVQITDQEALNCSGGRHCGNDFSAAAELPVSLIEGVREQTTRIGQWMASHGYRGLFGIDFVVNDATGALYAVDVNPRWQGSTTLQTQAERRHGRLPLAAAEAAYQVGVMAAGEVIALAPTFFAPLEGSHLFPKNFTAGKWEARGRLRAGIYTRAFEFVAPALRLEACDSRTEETVLVSGGIPRPGYTLAAGVTLLRVASTGAAVDARTARALPWVAETMRGLYRELALERVDSPG